MLTSSIDESRYEDVADPPRGERSVSVESRGEWESTSGAGGHEAAVSRHCKGRPTETDGEWNQGSCRSNPE